MLALRLWFQQEVSQIFAKQPFSSSSKWLWYQVSLKNVDTWQVLSHCFTWQVHLAFKKCAHLPCQWGELSGPRPMPNTEDATSLVFSGFSTGSRSNESYEDVSGLQSRPRNNAPFRRETLVIQNFVWVNGQESRQQTCPMFSQQFGRNPLTHSTSQLV